MPGANRLIVNLLGTADFVFFPVGFFLVTFLAMQHLVLDRR